MAQPHARPGDVVDVQPLGEALGHHVTTALFKSQQLEVVRLVLPRGKGLPQHHVQGEITLQCIEGLIDFSCGHRHQPLRPGQLIHLAAGEPHALHALEDSSALLTLVLAGP